MDLFEQLNLLLLEDKVKQDIAILEVFPPYELPAVKYGYHVAGRGSRRDMADNFKEIRLERELRAVMASTKGPERQQLTREHLFNARVKVPQALSQKWENEREKARFNDAEDIKKAYKDKPDVLKNELSRLDINLALDYRRRPLSKSELELIVKTIPGSITALYKALYNISDADYNTEINKEKDWIPLEQYSFDEHSAVSKFILDFIDQYSNADPNDINDLEIFIDELKNSEEYQDLCLFVQQKMRENHIEYSGDIKTLIDDVVANIENYDNDQEIYLGGSVRDLFKLVEPDTKLSIALSVILPEAKKDGITNNSSIEDLANWVDNIDDDAVNNLGDTYRRYGIGFDDIWDELSEIRDELDELGAKSKNDKQSSLAKYLAVNPTADDSAMRQLTNLPRNPTDARPRPFEIAKGVEIEKYKAQQSGLNYFPKWAWLVLTATERAGTKGIKPIDRFTDKGRPIGVCPYCDGEGWVGPNDEIKCQECGGGPKKGYDWAWYWASEPGYEAHPDNKKVQKIEERNPFERVVRSIWRILDNLGLNPEAYDGFKRKKPTQNDDPKLQGAGVLELDQGLPMPAFYNPYDVDELPQYATNTLLSTVVIKLNGLIGIRRPEDFWNNLGQEFLSKINDELSNIGLGASFEEAPPHLKVWDYIVEPGYIQIHNSDETIKNQFLDPDQPPFEFVTEISKVLEIAQYLDGIGEHEPYLWLSLGLRNKAEVGSYEQEDADLNYSAQLAIAIENIKQKPRFDKQEKLVDTLKDVLSLIKNNNYQFDDKLPSYASNYLRTKNGIEMMYYYKIFGVPADWSKAEGLNNRKSKALERRENLWNRAERIEEIWEDSDSPNEYQPHNYLKMALGLFWEIPKKFVASAQRRLDDEKKKYVESSDEKHKHLIVSFGEEKYSGHWVPIRYMEFTIEDLNEFIKLPKVKAGYKTELKEYLIELKYILARSRWKLLDPALRKRLNREQNNLKRFKEKDEPEERIAQRSFDIKKTLALFVWSRHSGRIKSDDLLNDARYLEAQIFLEIQKLVTERGRISDLSPNDLWLNRNVYKSFMQVKDEVETYLANNGVDLGSEGDLSGLVYPSSNLPVHTLRDAYLVLRRLNDDESLETEDIRRQLVTNAFKIFNKDDIDEYRDEIRDVCRSGLEDEDDLEDLDY